MERDRMTDRESEMAKEAERLLYEYDNSSLLEEAEAVFSDRFLANYKEKEEFENERLGKA